MVTEKEQIFINNFLKNEIVESKLNLIGGEFMLDYKMKIVGTKKMISVGEYYDYLLIDVLIVGGEERIKKIINIVTSVFKSKEDIGSWMLSDYLFTVSLGQSIREHLQVFESGSEHIRITINELVLSDQFYEDIKNAKV